MQGVDCDAGTFAHGCPWLPPCPSSWTFCGKAVSATKNMCTASGIRRIRRKRIPSRGVKPSTWIASPTQGGRITLLDIPLSLTPRIRICFFFFFFFKSFISQSCINHHGNTESGLLHKHVFLCGALHDCSNHEPEPKRPTGLLKQTDDVLLTPGDWSLTSSPTIPWCTPATRRSEFSKGQGPRARRRFKRFLGLAQGPNLRLLVAL